MSRDTTHAGRIRTTARISQVQQCSGGINQSDTSTSGGEKGRPAGRDEKGREARGDEGR
ncbi:hypothetical protein E2C01_084177 [Portunus trituberculatus]|uniref:Uncharacterized protein n=1 Tax=Portunus trituberculatus TaxID=210409 RepID=A0A5B7IXK9_PORTR|nr:hypothetical protein [Portunus trituberculatus]